MGNYFLRTKKEKGTASVYLRVQKRNPKLNILVCSKVSVDIQQWDKVTQDVAKWNDYCKTQDGRKVKETLDSISSAIDNLISQGIYDKARIDEVVEAIVFREERERQRIQEEEERQEQERLRQIKEQEEEARKADVILFLENFLEGIKNGRIKNGAENYTLNTCKVWSNFLGILKRFIQISPFTWKDINIKAKTVNVDHQLIYKNLGDGCKFHISTPKTESGIRIIPMTQEVAKAFEEQRKINFMLAKDKSIEVDGYSGFAFTAKSGRPLMPNGENSVLYNIVDAYNKTEVERAKKEHRKAELLPKFSAHVMRHTVCTRMAECRMDVKVL